MLTNVFLINKIVRFFALTAFKIMIECRKNNAKAKRKRIHTDSTPSQGFTTFRDYVQGICDGTES